MSSDRPTLSPTSRLPLPSAWLNFMSNRCGSACRRPPGRPACCPRVGVGALDQHVERDLAGDAVHREVAGHARGLVVDRLDVGGLERDLRELLDVEEVRRAQVLVALRLVVSIDATLTVPYARQSARLSFISSVPSNSVNFPRTLAMPMCLTENPTLECAGSTVQVPVGISGLVRLPVPVAIATSVIGYRPWPQYTLAPMQSRSSCRTRARLLPGALSIRHFCLTPCARGRTRAGLPRSRPCCRRSENLLARRPVLSGSRRERSVRSPAHSRMRACRPRRRATHRESCTDQCRTPLLPWVAFLLSADLAYLRPAVAAETRRTDSGDAPAARRRCAGYRGECLCREEGRSRRWWRASRPE